MNRLAKIALPEILDSAYRPGHFELQLCDQHLTAPNRGTIVRSIDMRRSFHFALAVCLAVMPNPLLAEGRLERAREEVREKASDDPPREKSSCWSSSGDDDDDCGCDADNQDSNSEWLVFGALAAPWWVPRACLDDNGFDASFAEFPYANDWHGFVVNELPPPDWAKFWCGRFATEYGSDFDGLDKIGGRLRLETASRFGIDTEWNRRTEAVFAGHDSFWSGDFNVVYRFAQSPRATFYTGLGVNWLADERRANAGFNFTYGADFFPARPWVLSGSFDGGRLGDATLIHGRATVGAIFDRVEIFTGCDYLNLEGTSLPSWVAGLQIWF